MNMKDFVNSPAAERGSMNQIKHRWTNEVIAEGEEAIKELAEKSRANLYEAYLRGAYLSGAYLYEANLRGANLNGAYLSGAYLYEAYLRGADLRGADLRGANLNGADLSGANLSEAEIEFYQFPSIRTLSSMPIKNIDNKLILELMRWDAQAHPKPELFDLWAKGGECPYKNEERWWFMPGKREIWKAGQPEMRLSDLILEICRQEGWGIKGYLPMKGEA